MKQCPDFETQSAAADGALGEAEAVAVQEHTTTCDRCSNVRAHLLALKAAVRGSTPDHHASEGLRAHLDGLVPRAPAKRRPPSSASGQKIDLLWAVEAPGRQGATRAQAHRPVTEEQRRRPGWIGHPKEVEILTRGTRWVWPVALAMLGCVLALFALLFRPARNGDLTSELVGDHMLTALNRDKPLHITSHDPRAVESWFAGSLDFAVSLPRMPQAKLAGGRLCTIAGRRVALAFYDLGPHRLSLFVMGPDGRTRGGACQEGIRGFSVCRRLYQGIEYALVSDLPAGEAGRLLEHGP